MKLKEFKSLDLSKLKSDTVLQKGQEGGKVPIDVFENKEEILIVTPIAGANLEEAEISITDDTLTISGERHLDLSPFSFKEKEAYLKECYWGTFSRSIVLPPHADIDEIEATEKNHILYVRIPKKKGVSMKIIKIKS